MATDPKPGEETVVTFDEKQQEKVNQLIREKQGEAAREVRAELATVKASMESLRTELTTAQADLLKAKTPTQKKDAKEDIDALNAKIDEMKTVHTTIQQELERHKTEVLNARKLASDKSQEVMTVKKQVAIQGAAGKANFVDVNMVTKLTEDSVKFDDTKNRWVVLGDNGQERFNSTMEPMTLDEFYTEYASKNPFLVRSDVRGGSGSTEAQRSGLSANGKVTIEQLFGPKSDSRIANAFAKENIAEYRRMKTRAKELGLA